jgi:hypothetical protein
LLLIVFFAPNARASFDIKGIALDAHVTAEQVEQSLPDVRCETIYNLGQSCRGGTTLIGHYVQVDVYLNDGAVYSITVTFDSQDYNNFAASCDRKFGKPSSRRHESLQNRFGATFDNESSTWSAQDSSRAILTRYASDPSTGLLMLDSARKVRDENAAAQKRERDF